MNPRPWGGVYPGLNVPPTPPLNCSPPKLPAGKSVANRPPTPYPHFPACDNVSDVDVANSIAAVQELRYPRSDVGSPRWAHTWRDYVQASTAPSPSYHPGSPISEESENNWADDEITVLSGPPALVKVFRGDGKVLMGFCPNYALPILIVIW